MNHAIDPIALTQTDRLILDSYKNLLNGLSDYFGEGLEIVLHSLEDLDHSVVKIVNGHHTGRSTGAPITDLALSMLKKINERDREDYISYFTQNKNKQPLKSSTILIRGEKQRVIGLICMNFYLNTPLYNILSLFQNNNSHLPETFNDSIVESIRASVEHARIQVEANTSIPPSLRNREIISLLFHQKIFSHKNAVSIVADCLGISPNTVYLHLRYCKSGSL